jgi:hypothetical protein
MRHIRHVRCFQLGGELALPFVATVLKPDFHLCLGEAQRSG